MYLLNYRYTAQLGDGSQLVIKPLATEWIPAATELLADTFIVALGAPAYKQVAGRGARGACRPQPPAASPCRPPGAGALVAGAHCVPAQRLLGCRVS